MLCNNKNLKLSNVAAISRAKQYKDDGMYADSGVMFCKYCSHSIDFTRNDTVRDYTVMQKSTNTAPKLHVTLATSSDQHCNFIKDFVCMCTLADRERDVALW